MPLHIVRNDITKMKVDAIVNAADPKLLGGGGVDGQIHATAGPGLLEECKGLGGCKTGEAKITGAYNLPCKYVIHTVGPVWHGGDNNEEQLLRLCYKNSLVIAADKKLETVAFPLISAGVYGYPKKEAFKVAVSAITDFLMDSDMDVYIVIFNKEFVSIGEKLFSDIEEYIDDNYVGDVMASKTYCRNRRTIEKIEYGSAMLSPEPSVKGSVPRQNCLAPSARSPKPKKLEDELKDIDESFSEMLLRIIDEKGMKDSETYKKANIDRKLFSKIRSNVNYKPSKPTVIAFAIALELSLPQTNDMLKKAGFALSHSNKSDIIVEYFIRNKMYNIFELNEALYSFDQPTLGTL